MCVFCETVRDLGCEGDGSAGVGYGGGVVALSAYMGGTRGLGVLACACDVLVIHVVSGVGGVYDKTTETETHVQHSPGSHRIEKDQTQLFHPPSTPSQTHTTYSTNSSHPTHYTHP